MTKNNEQTLKRELAHVKGLLTVANKLNQALLNEREKLKKENEILKSILKEENCHFDKIKELIKEM